jgi:mediator of RNA polymerase II transcription subunit 28
LVRKEELIQRHYEKIGVWQNLLADLQGWAKSPAQCPAPSGLTPQPGGVTVSGVGVIPPPLVTPQPPSQSVMPGMPPQVIPVKY